MDVRQSAQEHGEEDVGRRANGREVAERDLLPPRDAAALETLPLRRRRDDRVGDAHRADTVHQGHGVLGRRARSRLRVRRLRVPVRAQDAAEVSHVASALVHVLGAAAQHGAARVHTEEARGAADTAATARAGEAESVVDAREGLRRDQGEVRLLEQAVRHGVHSARGEGGAVAEERAPARRRPRWPGREERPGLPELGVAGRQRRRRARDESERDRREHAEGRRATPAPDALGAASAASDVRRRRPRRRATSARARALRGREPSAAAARERRAIGEALARAEGRPARRAGPGAGPRSRVDHGRRRVVAVRRRVRRAHKRRRRRRRGREHRAGRRRVEGVLVRHQRRGEARETRTAVAAFPHDHARGELAARPQGGEQRLERQRASRRRVAVERAADQRRRRRRPGRGLPHRARSGRGRAHDVHAPAKSGPAVRDPGRGGRFHRGGPGQRSVRSHRRRRVRGRRARGEQHRERAEEDIHGTRDVREDVVGHVEPREKRRRDDRVRDLLRRDVRLPGHIPGGHRVAVARHL
mmetsp:Transcript_4763/g.16991  ORF Transcript_4763/g.16991 Transcript_4763/m.16991 type:complete len:530 (+) Transcript_4763:498-2087(+)